MPRCDQISSVLFVTLYTPTCMPCALARHGAWVFAQTSIRYRCHVHHYRMWYALPQCTIVLRRQADPRCFALSRILACVRMCVFIEIKCIREKKYNANQYRSIDNRFVSNSFREPLNYTSPCSHPCFATTRCSFTSIDPWQCRISIPHSILSIPIFRFSFLVSLNSQKRHAGLGICVRVKHDTKQTRSILSLLYSLLRS